MPSEKARVASETPRTTITFTTRDNVVHKVAFERVADKLYVSEELDAKVAAELAAIDGYALHGALPSASSDATKPDADDAATGATETVEIPPADEIAELEKLKVVDLRDMAGKLGVKVGGRDNKATLIRNIRAAVKQAEAAAKKG